MKVKDARLFPASFLIAIAGAVALFLFALIQLAVIGANRKPYTGPSRVYEPTRKEAELICQEQGMLLDDVTYSPPAIIWSNSPEVWMGDVRCK